MARKPRILFPGALYHVYNRGNDRHPIFRDDDDRRKYLWYFVKYAQEMSVVLIAYCLLTNHFHFFLQTLLANLPVFMHRLHSAYAKWYNKKRGRTGHLYGSRYQASLVQEGDYALGLSTYIHLNPVKAGLVTQPDQWCWSSYRHYVGIEQISTVDSSIILEQFAANVDVQHEAYKACVLEGLRRGTAWDEPPLKAGLFLGDDTFIKEISEKYLPIESNPLVPPESAAPAPSMYDILDLILQESDLPFGTLKKSKRHADTYWRNIFILLARTIALVPLKELSQLLDLSCAEISRVKYRFERKVLTEKDLSKSIRRMTSALPGLKTPK